MLSNLKYNYKALYLFKRKEYSNSFKIFQNDYLETIVTYLQEINIEMEKNESNIVKIERKLNKFLILDKKIQIELKNNERKHIDTQSNNRYYRYSLLYQTSIFAEKCYHRRLYSQTISDINKILFYYLQKFRGRLFLSHPKKEYERKYFNPYLIIYYLENPNYDMLFKRFIVSQLIISIPAFSLSNFLILIKHLTELIIKDKVYLDLLYPFNPMQLDHNFMLEYFFSEDEELHLTRFVDILKSLDNYPVKEKQFLIENCLIIINKTYQRINTSTEKLIEFIPLISVIESSLNFNLSPNIKNVIQELKTQCILKLKQRFSGKHSNEYFNDPPYLLFILDLLIKNGKYIKDNEIFEYMFNMIVKCEAKFPNLNSKFKIIIERFVELFPEYITNVFIKIWEEKIVKSSRDETNDTLSNQNIINIFKCFCYYKSISINNKFDLNILEDFIKSFILNINDKHNFTNIEDFLTIIFLISYIAKFQLVNIDTYQIENIIYLCFDKVINYLQGNFELTTDNILFLENEKDVFSNNNNKNINVTCFNFDFLNDCQENIINYLELICLYYQIIQKNNNNNNKDNFDQLKIDNIFNKFYDEFKIKKKKFILLIIIMIILAQKN